MAGLTQQGFRDAWLAAFRTFWGGASLVTPVAWPNLPFDPAAQFPVPSGSDAWVRPVIQQQPEGDTPIGSSGYRFREGTVGFEVYARAEAGTDRSGELVEELLRFLESPAVEETAVRGLGTQEIGNDGTWFQVNVSGTFRYVTHRGAP